MTTTIAHLLKVWQQTKPDPVVVFCHPDDRQRITTALALMPGVYVIANQVVSAGQMLVATDVPFTEEEIRERL